MTATEVKLKTSDLMHSVTLNVKLVGFYRYQYRIKLGTWLIKLAARVMHMNVHIDATLVQRDPLSWED